jgi:hypothetical protein
VLRLPLDDDLRRTQVLDLGQVVTGLPGPSHIRPSGTVSSPFRQTFGTRAAAVELDRSRRHRVVCSAVSPLTFRDPSPPRSHWLHAHTERRSRTARDVVYLRRVRLPLGGGTSSVGLTAGLDEEGASDAINPSEHVEVEKWIACAIEAYFGTCLLLSSFRSRHILVGSVLSWPLMHGARCAASRPRLACTL